MKILIIKRDKLGDLLLATPMLRCLRAAIPDAAIHLLANDYNAWVVADEPAIDRIWVYRRARVGRSLRPGAAFSQMWLHARLIAERFDIALVAGGEESPRAIRRALAVRAQHTIAYASDARAYGRRFTDPIPPRGGHEVDRMFNLLAPLGIVPPAHPLYPAFQLPAAAAIFAQTWLTARGLKPNRFVVLGLGARRAKRQPTAEQIARWTARLAKEFGLATVFMWTPGKSDNPLYPGDDDVAMLVLKRKLPHLHAFRGPIREALGLIWSARTTLIPDSGLMHFAAASPGGVLGFFADTGPTPEQWGPRGPRARYLEAGSSVGELGDEEVFAALSPLLG